ncbi:hemolymph juvenile hormone-binding protein, partial [Oryctes borbonicus]
MFQKLTLLLCIAVTVATLAGAAKLPSYITACKRDPATLSDCATKEARKVLPVLLNGDKSLKIPKLNPLRLPEVKIDAGDNLKIKLSDVSIFGFEDHTIDKLDIDLNKQHIQLKVRFPRLNLQSKYEVNGQILVLPIRGSGPANITFVGGQYTYNTDFTIEKRGSDEHIQLTGSKLDYTTQRSYFQLDNLFDGDKVLGDQMNKFLDENWRDVEKD